MIAPTGSPAYFLRGASVVALPVAYCAYVFQVFGGEFLTSGLSAWLDPYFLNYLLEYWYASLWHLSDPASPPMYFPVRGTLGYSCGLILWAPFYIVVRPFLHPFPAYSATLILVIVTGSVCLYVIFRKFLSLTFLESVLLTVFFFTAVNVVGVGHANVWSQTLSVFLVPQILLITLAAWRIARPRPAALMAALSGLLWTLLFTQDFYTAWFCLLLGVLLAIGAILVIRKRTLIEACLRAWHTERPRMLAFAIGASLGASMFLWTYVGAYLEHPGFPDAVYPGVALIPIDLSGWRDPVSFVRALVVYHSARPFKLVFLVGIVVWLPWLKVPMRVRLATLWFLLISTIVVLGAVKFDDYLGWKNYSVWKRLFLRLPGFSIIRDPKRIIFLYELVVALVTGLFLAQLPRKSVMRIGTAVLVLVLLVAEPNRETFTYERPTAVFDRWVAAPIAIDPSCRSFFIAPASESYTSRYANIWGLYSIDAMFIALQRSLPTLNGYSAWHPVEWNLVDPLHHTYYPRVRRWIQMHHLEGVCELDIDARTMTPFK